MAERIEMVHSITGALMAVPAELVPEFEKAGHKRTAQVEPAEEGKDKKNK